jgi:hypothetical protein
MAFGGGFEAHANDALLTRVATTYIGHDLAGRPHTGSFRSICLRAAVGDTRFLVVDVDRITTYCGFSLADDGWHPFLELLGQYEHDRDLC